MGGAVEHTFSDQQVAHGRERSDLFLEDIGDLAGAVRPGPEFGHGAHVALLTWRQPIKAHAEKTRVEFGQRLNRCPLNVIDLDR